MIVKSFKQILESKELDTLMKRVSNTIKGNKEFDIKIIFPMDLKKQKVDIKELQLVDDKYKTKYVKDVKKNGSQSDSSGNLWVL